MRVEVGACVSFRVVCDGKFAYFADFANGCGSMQSTASYQYSVSLILTIGLGSVCLERESARFINYYDVQEK